jgi:hypothetical protein
MARRAGRPIAALVLSNNERSYLGVLGSPSPGGAVVVGSLSDGPALRGWIDQ